MVRDAGRFTVTDLDAAHSVLREVFEERTGDTHRWCNLSFEVDEELAPEPDSVLFGFLAARGPSSPLTTVMSARGGKRPHGPQLGIQHRAGPRCAEQLREASLELPDGWRVVQDHPRRGLVVALPDSTTVEEIAAWVLPAMHILNRAPTTDGVLYEVFEAS